MLNICPILNAITISRTMLMDKNSFEPYLTYIFVSSYFHSNVNFVF